jgi:hypothetical protein
MGAAVQPKRRQQHNEWESDSFIVLRGRESLLHVNVKQKRKQGEGMDRHTQLSKETTAGKKRLDRLLPTSLQSNSNKGKIRQKASVRWTVQFAEYK